MAEKTKLKSEIPVYSAMPLGWCVLNGATTAPRGYMWIWNQESRFSGNYKAGLLKDDKLYKLQQEAREEMKLRLLQDIQIDIS